uniref:Immunoglobulin V-set domain-containing protein n=1 Tax=Pygocentrus nattereri TaxID=42514 RepID=A0AAR2K0V1_PYGNA
IQYLWSAGVLFSRISGEEVEMRVRPGDDVTLYSDCVWKLGFNIVWFRNCSHDHQPPLIMSATTHSHHARIYNDFKQNPLPRYFFVWNSFSKTYHLLVKNVSESDLCLYYCALQERKIPGRDAQKDVFQYGNRTTRVSLRGKATHSDCIYFFFSIVVKMVQKAGEQWHPIKPEEASASDAQDGQLFNSAKKRNTQSHINCYHNLSSDEELEDDQHQL